MMYCWFFDQITLLLESYGQFLIIAIAGLFNEDVEMIDKG